MPHKLQSEFYAAFDAAIRYAAENDDYHGVRGNEPLGFDLPTGDGSSWPEHTPRKLVAQWLEDQGRTDEAEQVQWHDGPLTNENGYVQAGEHDPSSPVQLLPHEHTVLRNYFRGGWLQPRDFGNTISLGAGVLEDPHEAERRFASLIRRNEDLDPGDFYEDDHLDHLDEARQVHQMIRGVLSDTKRLGVRPLDYRDFLSRHRQRLGEET